jgi:hypothetical protein
MAKAKEKLRLHMTMDSQLWYKEIEWPFMIIYGIMWKFEGPFKSTDVETS